MEKYIFSNVRPAEEAFDLAHDDQDLHLDLTLTLNPGGCVKSWQVT